MTAYFMRDNLSVGSVLLIFLVFVLSYDISYKLTRELITFLYDVDL